MIYVKTRLKKMPKTCKNCPFARDIPNSDWRNGRQCQCIVTMQGCPWEKSPNGNWRYGKPVWCPLMEVKENG